VQQYMAGAYQLPAISQSIVAPAVIFTNKPVAQDNPGLVDAAPSILSRIGLEKTVIYNSQEYVLQSFLFLENSRPLHECFNLPIFPASLPTRIVELLRQKLQP